MREYVPRGIADTVFINILLRKCTSHEQMITPIKQSYILKKYIFIVV